MSNRMLLEGLIEDYDALTHLECDGFSRVVTYVLKTNGVGHTVYEGRCIVGEKTVEPHFWVTAGRYIIDYRLQVWAGNDAPHGVFEASSYPHVKYEGEPVDMQVSSVLFDILQEIPQPLKQPKQTKKKKN